MGVFTVQPSSTKRPLLGWSLLTLVLWLLTCAYQLYAGNWDPPGVFTHETQLASLLENAGATGDAGLIRKAAQHFIEHPIRPPYKDQFGEFGGRVQLLREWAGLAGRTRDQHQREALWETTERLASSLFPFLGAVKPTRSPLQNLRSSFTTPRGIVIPTGIRTFRATCHLVASLRQVLDTQMPIQIAYAGEQDLPARHRDDILALSRENPVGFQDIFDLFDNSTLRLPADGGALKAFAALAAPFREMIVLDPEVVLLQSPEVLFDQEGYVESGALFFHDRLLWQHGFPERHKWWHAQVKHPSPQLSKSAAWARGYSEQQDSSVLVVDKTNLESVAALLHVAWQNTYDVRKEVTYPLTQGDKESWWLGFELAGAPYAFSERYAGTIGWRQDRHGSMRDEAAGERVCSFATAHLDDRGHLLWYSGGLLKNKMALPKTFEVPTHWGVGGKWERGMRPEDMSCMLGGEHTPLTKDEGRVLEQAMALAQQMDSDLNLV